MKYLILIVILALYTPINECFIPAKILDYIAEKFADSNSKMDLGQASKSMSHEEILRRGLIRSIARYFYDQPGGSKRVNLNDMDRYFQSIHQLYSDYYGKKVHLVELDMLLTTELKPYVAVVDLDPKTKDLPTAHFDAERFIESNQRVMTFSSLIYTALAKRNFAQARKLAAQILHTIQDFYSHSNWIEMGNYNQINTAIGSIEFNRLPISKLNDPVVCNSNCELVRVQCSTVLKTLVSMVREFKPKVSLKCPLDYYKCKSNIAVLDKLVSGYYVNQKLEDGTRVENPGNLMKCNHGGILDADSMVRPALGGINKDSGMFVISPHADLHLTAAKLAELHTEYFFNSIRKQIGDAIFSEFLKIEKKLFK